MTTYNKQGVTLLDFASYNTYQKNIFLAKADIPLSKKNLKESYSNQKDKDTYLNVICEAYFNQKLTRKISHNRSTLHEVYEVSIDNDEYIVRINLYNNLYKELGFYTGQWINAALKRQQMPYCEILTIDTSRSIVPFDYEIYKKLIGTKLYDLISSSKFDN